MNKSSSARQWLLVAGCAMVIAGGILLPPAIASARDNLITQQVHQSEAELPLTLEGVELSVIEKLVLLEADSGTSLFPLDTGSALDNETARAAVINQLKVLVEKDIIPSVDLPEDYLVGTEIGQPFFILNSQEPGKNIIIWRYYFWIEGIEGEVYMDDASGLILQMRAYSETFPFYDIVATEWLDAWADYLGVNYIGGYPTSTWRYGTAFSKDGIEVEVSHALLSNSVHFGMTDFSDYSVRTSPVTTDYVRDDYEALGIDGTIYRQ